VCAIRFQPIDAIWSIDHVIQKAATHKWSRPGAGFIDIHLASDEKLGPPDRPLLVSLQQFDIAALKRAFFWRINVNARYQMLP
jgi:hypothetical protein